MLLRAILGAVLLTSLPIAPAAGAAGEPSPTRKVGLILHDGVTVRAKPSSHARVLAKLVQQTQVEVVGKHGSWSHVRLWASIRGWIPAKEITFKRPWETSSTYQAPTTKTRPHAYGPEALRAKAVTISAVPLVRWKDRARVGTLPGGTAVTVTGWRQDKLGQIWYRVGRTWISGDSARFRTPDPGTVRVRGTPIWKPVTGKGMWLTLGTATGEAAETVARAAQRNGMTHLYVEAAISPLGFHGRGAVDDLLSAAHRRHIAVVAWVYPYLEDIAADVRLTRRVAGYTSPAGERFDGIASDIERNFTEPRVRAYSQLVRSALGPSYLLVGVTYPPQSFARFPFAEVARSYNAIAPMDYWHQTRTVYGLDYGHMAYGADYARRYARDSIAAIRRVSGHVPVTTIGQTFDDFGRLEMGPHAPSPAEIKGFLQGSKEGGAIGASFFQWMTATEGEWRAIKSFRY